MLWNSRWWQVVQGKKLTLKVKAAQDGTKGSRSIAIMSKVMTSNTCIATCL